MRVQNLRFKVQSLNCLVATWALLFGFSTSGHAQDVFQNLNFEAATNLPNLGPNETAIVPFSNALPAWTGYLGDTNQISVVGYNGVSAGAAAITLIGHSSAVSNYVIAGNYTVTIDAGEVGPNAVSAAIAQTGTVSLTAQSLRFDANGNVVDYLTVTFDGQNIAFSPISAGPNYEVYGGDISAYAGQTGELRFTENPTASDPFAIAGLDNILFSIAPIPEPGVWALMLCGVALFGAARYAKPKN